LVYALALIKPLMGIACLNVRDFISMQGAKRLHAKNGFIKEELRYYGLLNSISKVIINLATTAGLLSVYRVYSYIEACGGEGT
jgi:hypothetical protein